VSDAWIIYAVFGILVCLLLWRVATQWKVKSAEAENLRVTVVIVGVVALVFIVWQYVQQASPIAAQDKTITVFAAASMTNALDDVNAAFTKQTGIKVVHSL
jgi:ABC-type molybdate transport system substrate-binding protein